MQQPQNVDLAELYRLHGRGLAGAARAIVGQGDVQEVVQEAMLRAWRSLHGGFVPDDPTSWLFVITMNTARDLRRKMSRRPTAAPLDEERDMTIDSKTPGASHRLDREEDLAAARAAIHYLGEGEKEVFILRTSAELSFEAIAKSLGIPVGTAKTRMRTALMRLREILRQQIPTIERG